MILQCPSCTARFLVADALIPETGRTVKCGKCAHQWFTTRAMEPDPIPFDIPGMMPEATVKAETPAAVPDFAALTAQAYSEATPQPHDPKQLPTLPVRHFPAKPFMIAVPLLAALWLVLAIFAYFPNWQSGPLSGIYGAMGASDTQGLVFSNVTMERQELGARTRFLLSGSIANQGTHTKTVPVVRVQVKDANSEVLWSQTYAVGEVVKPGELYPFRIENVETSFAARAASIVLDIGNSFELAMR